MFKKIKQALAVIGLKPTHPVAPATSFIVAEDERLIATKKRVNQAFDDQWNQMQLKGLKPHAFDCLDPFTCTKQTCFIWEPDKIIREYQVNNNLVEIPVATEDKKE